MRSKAHTALTAPLVLHHTRIYKRAMKKIIFNGQMRDKPFFDCHLTFFTGKSLYTVLRARIIFLKKVHPAKRARAQELYIVSSYTYAFNETFTWVWIFLWSVSLEWQEAHLDDGFTQKTPPPASPQIFKWSSCSSSLPLIGRRAGPWLGDTGPDWAIRGGGTGVNFFLHLNLVSIIFDHWQNINKKPF